MTSTSLSHSADQHIGHIRPRRSKLIPPLIVLLLTIAAIAAVWTLVDRASDSRVQQLHVSAVRLSLADLQGAPFAADPAAGGTPKASTARIEQDEDLISFGLTSQAQADVSPRLLQSARTDLAGIESLVATVYKTAVQKGGLEAAGASVVLPMDKMMGARVAGLTGILTAI